MNLSDFFDAAQAAGLRTAGKAAFGVMGGYPVLVRLNNGSTGNVVMLTISMSQADAKQVRKQINEASEKLYSSFALPDGLSLQFSPKHMASALPRIEATVPPILRENSVAQPHLCPLCKQEGCDSYAQVGAAYTAVHAACLDNLHSQTADKVEHNEEHGNYLTGLVGAVLGGLVGCLPNVLSIIWANTLYALLFALIPLGAYYGYKLLGGKQNRAGVTITCAVSLAWGVVIMPLVLALQMWMDGVPVARLMRLFRGPMLNDMLLEIAKALLFVGLGIYFVWSRISHTAGAELSNVATMRETLLPMNSRELPQ